MFGPKAKSLICYTNDFGSRRVAKYESWAVRKSDGKRHAKHHPHRPKNLGPGGPRSYFVIDWGGFEQGWFFLLLFGGPLICPKYQSVDFVGEGASKTRRTPWRATRATIQRPKSSHWTSRQRWTTPTCKSWSRQEQGQRQAEKAEEYHAKLQCRGEVPHRTVPGDQGAQAVERTMHLLSWW